MSRFTASVLTLLLLPVAGSIALSAQEVVPQAWEALQVKLAKAVASDIPVGQVKLVSPILLVPEPGDKAGSKQFLDALKTLADIVYAKPDASSADGSYQTGYGVGGKKYGFRQMALFDPAIKQWAADSGWTPPFAGVHPGRNR